MRALPGMLAKRRVAGAGAASGRKKRAHAGVGSPAHPAACFERSAARFAPQQARKSSQAATLGMPRPGIEPGTFRSSV